MIETTGVTNRSLHGHLHATVALNDRGESYVREQSHRVPLHLSKPHTTAQSLVLNIVSPTAGLFDGDTVELRIKAESGTRVVLTTPSSTRIHQARSSKYATFRQEISVASGAFLEYYPEPIIPQKGSRYRQQTTLRVESGGSLVFFEWLSPGRVASGEAFAYDELCWETDFHYNNRLSARERYRLNPDDASLAPLKKISPTCHYLGAFVCGDFPFPKEQILTLASPEVYLGCGPLAHGGHTIKALCADSLAARRTLANLRKMLYAAQTREMPTLGRF
jgi:urease accessory protein